MAVAQTEAVEATFCEFEWKIPCFNLNSQEGYISRTFSCAGTSWCMSVCPNGFAKYNSVGYVGVYLVGLSHFSTARLQVYFKIKTADAKKDEKRYTDEVLLAKGYVVYGIHKLISKDELSKRSADLLPSNTLMIFCSIKRLAPDDKEVCDLKWSGRCLVYLCRTCQIIPSMCLCCDCFHRGNHKDHDFKRFISGDGNCDCGHNANMKESGFCDRHGPQHEINMSEAVLHQSEAEEHIPLLFLRQIQKLCDNNESIYESLSQDLKKMHSEGKYHDVILKIGDKELYAHRDVLRARSHVFQSMLDHDMEEKKTGVIKVNDCDPQAMQLFLSYVYTGKVEILDQSNVFALYYIADKYDMPKLKDKCCDFITKTFSNTNICQAIQLAVDHSDTKLLEKASEYFFENTLDITVTLEWKAFLKDNTTLGNELFRKSFKLKDTKD